MKEVLLGWTIGAVLAIIITAIMLIPLWSAMIVWFVNGGN